MSTDSIVIVSAARTPIAGLLGDFSALPAWELGAVAIRAAVERAGVPAELVNEVLMGNCLMAGQGQAPARQATLKAGLPLTAGAEVETKNRFAVGDRLEIIHPSGNRTLTLAEMQNVDGEAIAVAQGSPIRVWIPLPAPCDGALITRLL